VCATLWFAYEAARGLYHDSIVSVRNEELDSHDDILYINTEKETHWVKEAWVTSTKGLTA